jgi:uncharacterized damage-inducible protein DinB
MEMRDYILETFRFNDESNKKQLQVIKTLPNPTECVKIFSHVINSQYKWMSRITQVTNAGLMEWWDPVYPIDQLELEWDKSLVLFIDYFKALPLDELEKGIMFSVHEDKAGHWSVTPMEIALQLNYHCIHHRAQMQTLIRAQGIEPEHVDYIYSRVKLYD